MTGYHYTWASINRYGKKGFASITGQSISFGRWGDKLDHFAQANGWVSRDGIIDVEVVLHQRKIGREFVIKGQLKSTGNRYRDAKAIKDYASKVFRMIFVNSYALGISSDYMGAIVQWIK